MDRLRGLFGGQDRGKDEIAQYAASVFRSTRDRAQSALGDRRFRVETHRLGELVLPSGRLAACDPWVGRDMARPFTRVVQPGRYPVEADVAVLEDNGDQRVAAAVVWITEREPVNWEPALDGGERRAPRNLEKVVGYTVDSGTGCFASPEALAALTALPVDGADDDPLINALEANDVPTWSHADLKVAPNLNVVAFSTGYGDGAYATFWGLDGQGAPVCALTDFGFVEWNAEA